VAKFGVLANLAAAGEPLPLRALAERAACVRSNITQLIDRLEVDRLVLRAPDPVDRRSIRAELTEEGRARYEKGLEALQQAESAVFAHMAPRDVESLVAMLESLRNAG
jgi:DNA-binding MarR family transcriptional regulator